MSRSIRMSLPSLAREGWPRHQLNGPFPLKSADGVVRSTSDNRWLERTTPSAPAKEASRLFLNGRSHPSFAKEYLQLSCGQTNNSKELFICHAHEKRENKFMQWVRTSFVADMF